MSLPIPGDLAVKFNRVYIVVNPDANQGPPTYRVSNPDQIGGGGGGSGGGAEYLFKGDAPILVDTIYSTAGAKNVVTTSMDIQDLEDRVN